MTIPALESGSKTGPFEYKRGMRAAFLAVVLALATLPALGQNRAPAARAPDVHKAVTTRVKESLDAIQDAKDFDAARLKLGTLFDEVIAFAPATDAEAFREADFSLRLITQLSEAPEENRVKLLAFLRKHDQLAQDLVFLVKPENKLKGVYGLLDRLREKYGDELGPLAGLTAAVCVVHDRPYRFRINENNVQAPDGVAIFEYFRANQKSMVFPIAKVPPELLLTIVDVTSGIDELEWARKKYAGHAKVGDLYFDVKYDYASYSTGAPKKVTTAGFSLPNILAHGGVCADQAYFAMEVGKAIGVPTTWVSGRNADMAHAWVGYVEIKGDKVRWNFDSGHYAGYQGVRGSVKNPQTQKQEPDSALGLIAEMTAANASSRRAAIALTDAAIRLGEIQKARTPFPPAESGLSGKQPRQATLGDRLDLLEAGLRRCPTYAPGWQVLIDASKKGELTFKDKKRWADVLDKLCAGKYPDFTLDVLRPMVETVEDVKERDALWNSLFANYEKRPDLAAEIRFAQGSMWEKSGDRARSWDCYQDVIKRYADDGPFTVDAARRCERLLKDSGKDREVAPLYASLWPRLTKPSGAGPEFTAQSNWFQIGALYAARLESDGQASKADEIRGKLGMPKKK